MSSSGLSKRRRNTSRWFYGSLLFAIVTFLTAQYLGSILLNPKFGNRDQQGPAAPFENLGSGDNRKMLEFEDLEGEEETCDSWSSCGDGEEKAEMMIKTYLLAKKHKLTQDKIARTVFKVKSNTAQNY